MPKFARFAEYAAAREPHRGGAGETEAALAAFAMMQELDTFECGEPK
jgi:hypothetical protein